MCFVGLYEVFFLNLKLLTYLLFISFPGESQPFTKCGILWSLLFLSSGRLKMLNESITDYIYGIELWVHNVLMSKVRWSNEKFQRAKKLFLFMLTLWLITVGFLEVLIKLVCVLPVWVTEINIFFFFMIWHDDLSFSVSVFTIFMPLWLYISFISSLPWCCSLLFKLNKNTSKETKKVL